MWLKLNKLRNILFENWKLLEDLLTFKGQCGIKECIKADGRGFCYHLIYKPHPPNAPVLHLNFLEEKSPFNPVRISEVEMKEGNETAENFGWATAIQMFIIICYKWNFILSSSSGLSFPAWGSDSQYMQTQGDANIKLEPLCKEKKKKNEYLYSNT